jgi:hypothetical protein
MLFNKIYGFYPVFSRRQRYNIMEIGIKPPWGEGGGFWHLPEQISCCDYVMRGGHI